MSITFTWASVSMSNVAATTRVHPDSISWATAGDGRSALSVAAIPRSSPPGATSTTSAVPKVLMLYLSSPSTRHAPSS